jgi:hypothetical protein
VVVTPAAGLAPVSTIAPVISGTARIGGILSTDDGSWLNTPLSYAYQWYADDVAIPSATSSSYLVDTAYVGAIIHVVVTATNNNGTASRQSDDTAPVEGGFAITAGSIVLSGKSVLLGSTRELLITESDIAASGSSVSLRRALKLYPTSKNIAVAGQSVTLTYTPLVLNILDSLTATPTSAGSVHRRLRSAYVGPLIRVFRSSDLAQSDFGTGADTLDVAALETWINAAGTADAYINTVYDQSGNGNNWTIASTATAPKIAASGVVSTTINSLPTMTGDGATSSRVLVGPNTSVLLDVDGFLMIALAVANAGGNAANMWENPALFGATNANPYPCVTFRTTGTQIQALGQEVTGSANKINTYTHGGYPLTGVMGMFKDSNELRAFVNGDTSAATAAADVKNPATPLWIMKNNTGTGSQLDGGVVEFMTFDQAPSDADLNTLGANMAQLGGQSWTTVDWT